MLFLKITKFIIVILNSITYNKGQGGGNMKLSEKTQLEIGTVIKRFEAEEPENAQTFQVLTLKDFNEALGEPYRGSADKQLMHVEKNDISKLTLVDGERMVIHLLTQKAVVLSKNCDGYVIPSNFVKVELDEDIYASYFEWYFNNHPTIQRQIAMLSQGSVLTTFSLKQLKDIEIEVPPMEKQQIIGDIYALRKQKALLSEKVLELENQLLEQKFISFLEGGNDNE